MTYYVQISDFGRGVRVSQLHSTTECGFLHHPGSKGDLVKVTQAELGVIFERLGRCRACVAHAPAPRPNKWRDDVTPHASMDMRR